MKGEKVERYENILYLHHSLLLHLEQIEWMKNDCYKLSLKYAHYKNGK